MATSGVLTPTQYECFSRECLWVQVDWRGAI